MSSFLKSKTHLQNAVMFLREETDYRFKIILYMHRIFQIFEFAASGGAVSQKRLHQKNHSSQIV